MKKETTTIAELQGQAAKAINDLYAAMKAANYQMILPMNFFSLAFSVDDTEKGYVFKPNNLVEVSSFTVSASDEVEPKTIIQKRQKPSFREISRQNNPPRMVTRGFKIDE